MADSGASEATVSRKHAGPLKLRARAQQALLQRHGPPTYWLDADWNILQVSGNWDKAHGLPKTGSLWSLFPKWQGTFSDAMSDIRQSGGPVALKLQHPESDKYCTAELLTVGEEEQDCVRLLTLLPSVPAGEPFLPDESLDLHDAAERFRLMGETLPYGVWMTDAKGKARYLSESWLQMVGLSMQEAKGFGWVHKVHPQDRGAMIRKWRHCVATGDEWEHEQRFLAADGGVRVVLSRGRPILGVGGEIQAWAGINLDITDRKADERRLKRQKNELEKTEHELQVTLADQVLARMRIEDLASRYRTVFDTVAEGLFLILPSGEVAEANEAGLRLHGFDALDDRSNYIGKYRDTMRLLDDSGADIPFEQWPTLRALRGEEVCGFEGILHIIPTGAEIPIRANSRPVKNPDGSVASVVLTLHDISESRKTREKILHLLEENRSQRALLQRVFDLAPLGIAVLETSTYRCSLVNEAFREWMPPEEFCRPGPERQEALLTPLMGLLDQVHSTGRPLKQSEFPILTATQDKTTRRYFDLTMEPFITSGEVEAILLIAVETTEKVKHRKSSEKMTSKITKANEELKAFAYSVSHDLRSPLQSINMFSQLLVRDFAAGLDQAGVYMLQRIIHNVRKSSQLLDDLLRLSRISQQELKREEVDLTKLAGDILADLRKSRPDDGIEYRVAEGLKVNADARLLQLALYNLLENAWKYSSKTDHPKVEVGCELHEEKPIYYVRDNGAGFDSKKATGLFQPFQRFHDSKEFSGTGIGLSIVQRVLQRHEGSVWAQSSPGQGAVFFFSLDEE